MVQDLHFRILKVPLMFFPLRIHLQEDDLKNLQRQDIFSIAVMLVISTLAAFLKLGLRKWQEGKATKNYVYYIYVYMCYNQRVCVCVRAYVHVYIDTRRIDTQIRIYIYAYVCM